MSDEAPKNPVMVTEPDHIHVCQGCKKNFGCQRDGCREWYSSTCSPCFDTRFLKAGGKAEKEEKAEEVVG